LMRRHQDFFTFLYRFSSKIIVLFLEKYRVHKALALWVLAEMEIF
jgi:hypothetical protein